MATHPVDRPVDDSVDTAVVANPPPLPCAHFDAGRCRSCTLLPVPTLQRLDDLQSEIAALLDPHAAQSSPARTGAAHTTRPTYWQPPVRSPEAGFRNKAKMVAGGTAEEPTLGLVDVAGHGIDLSDCPLYPPAIHSALAALPALIRRAQVSPYDVARRRGELKHVLVTASPDGELMIRFVLRTRRPAPRLQEHLALLTDPVTTDGFQVRVVTANIQPEHAAVLEGLEEIHLHGDEALTVRQGRIPLRVRPQSFLQTNTHVASQLYEQVAAWVDDTAAEAPTTTQPDPPSSAGPDRSSTEAPTTAQPDPPSSAGPDRSSTEAPITTQHRSPFVVWDLFCGVGGFALHCATPVGDASRTVIGVEVSDQAIESATRTAQDLGLDVEFTTADAALFAAGRTSRPAPGTPATGSDPGTPAAASAAASETATPPHPDLLIANPPRRGLGDDLAAWVEDSDIRDVIYSSCNPRSLAKDLRTMASYRITAARLLDMFPHTAHAEVVVRLRRM